MITQLQHEPFNVLLADDDTDDCGFFKEALKEFSLPTNLTIVQDGEQLLNRLLNEEHKLPDVLFLDINMPRKNGFECLTEIKLNKRLENIPVIIYTTSFHKNVADLLYDQGANYYISKPSQISQLKTAVQKMITLVSEKNYKQAAKEDFLLTEERKNYKAFVWFRTFFFLPTTSDNDNLM